ncbi:trypsin-like serine protease [Methylocucumis oryzae]|uniref:trypsin-like serine protease n=1 Tax=Methylocucumis oryzae TaxID=1632867 RepID=UPI000696F8AC|nr:trypsin-like serine protease [Methylocucumis oryzae]
MNIKRYAHCLLLILLTALTLPLRAEVMPPIVGGQVAKAGDWPWMVALVTKGLDNYSGQFCGGSLIKTNWVITAAHCLIGESTSTFQVLTGVTDLKNDTGKRYSVKRIIRHPSYNKRTENNDLALIQLTTKVTNTDTLPLIIDNPNLTGIDATIIGWGALSERDSDNGDYPEQLYEATLPIVSNTACKASYGARWITDNMLCAGYKAGGVDSCQGDSGGPLIIDQGGKWRLAGVTSNGNGCARPRYYGIYTRVSRYKLFINQYLNTNFAAQADLNSDGVVNETDKSVKAKASADAFNQWDQQCWRQKQSCADVNHDGVVSSADFSSEKSRFANDFKNWLDIYWQPEVNNP